MPTAVRRSYPEAMSLQLLLLLAVVALAAGLAFGFFVRRRLDERKASETVVERARGVARRWMVDRLLRRRREPKPDDNNSED